MINMNVYKISSKITHKCSDCRKEINKSFKKGVI